MLYITSVSRSKALTPIASLTRDSKLVPKPPPPTTFHSFTSLPPEVRGLIWKEALSNCFCTHIRMREIQMNSKAWYRVACTPVTGWNKRSWLRLRLACRDANYIAKDTYGEERPSQEDRRYMPEPEEEELKHRALLVVLGERWD